MQPEAGGQVERTVAAPSGGPGFVSIPTRRGAGGTADESPGDGPTRPRKKNAVLIFGEISCLFSSSSSCERFVVPFSSDMACGDDLKEHTYTHTREHAMRQYITHTHTHRVVHSIGARTLSISQTNDAEESSPTRHSSSSSRAYTSLARCDDSSTDRCVVSLKSIVRMVSCVVSSSCDVDRCRSVGRSVGLIFTSGEIRMRRRLHSVQTVCLTLSCGSDESFAFNEVHAIYLM
jgi:hypothetical protein